VAKLWCGRSNIESKQLQQRRQATCQAASFYIRSLLLLLLFAAVISKFCASNPPPPSSPSPPPAYPATATRRAWPPLFLTYVAFICCSHLKILCF